MTTRFRAGASRDFEDRTSGPADAADRRGRDGCETAGAVWGFLFTSNPAVVMRLDPDFATAAGCLPKKAGTQFIYWTRTRAFSLVML